MFFQILTIVSFKSFLLFFFFLLAVKHLNHGLRLQFLYFQFSRAGSFNSRLLFFFFFLLVRRVNIQTGFFVWFEFGCFFQHSVKSFECFGVIFEQEILNFVPAAVVITRLEFIKRHLFLTLDLHDIWRKIVVNFPLHFSFWQRIKLQRMWIMRIQNCCLLVYVTGRFS